MGAAVAGDERLTSAIGKLVLFLADGTTLDIPLDHERVTVGRRATNDICLPYAAVSGAHAVFVTVPIGVVIEDLGSTNGTTVNGKRTAKHVLQDGDEIDIGRQRLMYFADVNAAVPPPTGRVAAEDQPAGERGSAATEPIPASLGLVPAETARESLRSRAPRDALASVAPAARDMPWLSQPGPNGSLDAGNPAAQPAYGSTPNAIATEDQPPTSPANTPASGGPILKVLTGPSAGRTLALTKNETLIGRVGLQVVAVRKAENAYRLSVAEGDLAPRVNGVAVPPEGVQLQPEDAIEVAGARLVFLARAEALSS